MAAKKKPTAKKATTKKAANGYLVPLDYIDPVVGPTGSGSMSESSGKNARFNPKKNKVVGGGEGPVRASKTYQGLGKLSKKTTFTRGAKPGTLGGTRKKK
jgi:hypothetical protein